MKKSQLREMVREEVRKTLKEVNAPASSEVLSMLADPKLKKAMNQLSDQMSPAEYSEIYKLYTDLYLKIKEYEGGMMKEDNNSTKINMLNQRIASVFKKMGVNVADVDCAKGSAGMTPPTCTVKFKNFNYDGGMDGFMIDYEDARYDDASNKEIAPSFSDYEDVGGGKVRFYFDNDINEASAAGWSKQQLDKELKMLQQGGQEMGGSMDDAMAFDIANSWISDNPGVEQAIKKHYGASDAAGFVANYIA